MSLFASLFGNGGSDKADKMRQAAIDAFGAIKTPELAALQVQLNDYVNAGKLTPEQAEAQLLGSNAFNAIQSDPDATGAQKLALNQLQDIGSKGGMTAIDRAQLQDITSQQNQEARSRNEAVMQQAQQRGVGNSDLNTVNQLLNEQGAADRASQAGTNVAANAQQRALQALQAAGSLGGQIEGQQYGEKANKAASQNAIDQFNTSTQNQFNMANTLAANQAQAANLANAQDVANRNTETQNANKTYNAQQNQTAFNDQMAKANGVAGTYNNWANSAQDQATREQGANVGLTSGLVSAGMTAANPIAGAFTSGATSGATTGLSNGASTNSGYKRNSDGSYNFAEGGEVEEPHYVQTPDGGKMLIQKAPDSHAGDALKDLAHFTDSAKLHAKAVTNGQDPTRLQMAENKPSLEDEFAEFVQKYCYGGTVNMANGGAITYKPPKDMRKSAEVPGKPMVPHNNPVNDTVPAKLSPDEYVISIDDRKKIENATGDHIGNALKRLMNPAHVGSVRG